MKVKYCNRIRRQPQSLKDVIQLDAERLSAALNAGQALILAMGVAAVMALTGMNVARGTMTIGDLVLANGLILQISGPLQVHNLFPFRDKCTSFNGHVK